MPNWRDSCDSWDEQMWKFVVDEGLSEPLKSFPGNAFECWYVTIAQFLRTVPIKVLFLIIDSLGYLRIAIGLNGFRNTQCRIFKNNICQYYLSSILYILVETCE